MSGGHGDVPWRDGQAGGGRVSFHRGVVMDTAAAAAGRTDRVGREPFHHVCRVAAMAADEAKTGRS